MGSRRLGLLIDAGRRFGIHDSKRDGDALDWAQFFNRLELARILKVD